MNPSEQQVSDAAVAIGDLVGRTGATAFQVGYVRDAGDPGFEYLGPGWNATAFYRGSRLFVEDRPDVVDACDALARLLLNGGHCTRCARRSSTFTRWHDDPRVCSWRRIGDRWTADCEAS
jgi:hypothetical protein